MNRPTTKEYPEWYDKYVQTVPDGNIVDIMTSQLKSAAALLNKIDEQKSLYRYAEGKWSIKELLGHLNDTERVLSYRALRFIRKDKTDLATMDENKFVEAAEFDKKQFEPLKKEFRFIRKSTIMLFDDLNENCWLETGISGGKTFTVRSMAYIIVGHVNHHLNILEERYL